MERPDVHRRRGCWLKACPGCEYIGSMETQSRRFWWEEGVRWEERDFLCMQCGDVTRLIMQFEGVDL